jgi:hypothetical protein
MLSRNVIPKFHFLEVLATFDTFVHFFWTIFQMKLEVTFLASAATLQWAFHFKFANNLVEAHIGLELVW